MPAWACSPSGVPATGRRRTRSGMIASRTRRSRSGRSASLRSAVSDQRADPAGDGGVPGAVDLTAGQRRRGHPVGRGRRPAIAPQLAFHALDQPVVGGGTRFRRRGCGRGDRSRSPTSRGPDRGRRRRARSLIERRLEQVGGRTIVLVEEQRLAEADDEVEPIARRSDRRGRPTRSASRAFGEVGGIGGVGESARDRRGRAPVRPRPEAPAVACASVAAAMASSNWPSL